VTVEDGQGQHNRNGNGRRKRIIAAAALAALAIGVAVVGPCTHWFGLQPDPRRAVAIDRCQAAVRQELRAPAQAQFHIKSARHDIITEDDHVRLSFEAKNVLAMWGVTGTVESPARSGQTASIGFSCRAAFFADQRVDTAVNYFGADLPGQLA